MPLASGAVNISVPIRFGHQSSVPIVFTLTCISTGGPATNVTWTRDGAAATGVASQTVVNQTTATYHNTLTVTGRLLGDYQCSVTNARTTEPATALLSVNGETL